MRLFVGCFLLATLAAAPAQAQLAEVERRYQSGRFRDAIDAVQRSLGSARLDERSLARLLELEALSHHALGARGEMERSLAWLASLDAGFTLSSAAPPPVVAAYARARERAMQVDISIVEQRGHRRVELTVVNAPEGFVREQHLRVRFDGGPWVEGTAVEVPADASNVQGYAWIVGPGRVQTHAIGSAARPLPLVALPAAALAPSAPPASGSDDPLLWGVVTGGVIVTVIAAAIAIGFALTPADDTILVPHGP